MGSVSVGSKEPGHRGSELLVDKKTFILQILKMSMPILTSFPPVSMFFKDPSRDPTTVSVQPSIKIENPASFWLPESVLNSEDSLSNLSRTKVELKVESPGPALISENSNSSWSS